jgi:hypothetical protein
MQKDLLRGKTFCLPQPNVTRRSKMYDLTSLFCSVDDFWKLFEKGWKKHLIDYGKPKRGPNPELSISEMMTIIILFHQSNYRTFKHFYSFVCQHLKQEFPKLISYSRFVHLTKNPFVPITY